MLKTMKQALEHGSFPQGSGIIHDLKKAIKELESQEPVAWRAPNWGHSADEYVYRDFDDPVIGVDGKPSPNNEPLYTHPPHRTWQGLTDEDLSVCDEDGVILARYWESKLKDKNK